MVERPGTAPGIGCLQNIRAAFCSSHGAQTWFRAKLSGFSDRRFHQISFLSIVFVWRGQGELNSRYFVGNEADCRNHLSASGAPPW